MNLGVEPPNQRIPTLLSYCQRVAAQNVESISSFGDELRYEVIKPLLESCEVNTLQRLELASPRLIKETHEIWKDWCLRKHNEFAEGYRAGNISEPSSWRNKFFALEEAREQRFEDIRSRIRSYRGDLDEHKKESQVRYTEYLPQKRPRSGWSTGPVQPKTLFQKTRSEASKIQKSIYKSRMNPPLRRTQDKFLKPKNNIALLPPPSTSCQGRVVVKTVMRKSATSPTSSRSSSAPSPPVSSAISPVSAPSSASSGISTSYTSSPSDCTFFRRLGQSQTVDVFAHSTCMDLKPIKSVKKDPMASLFVPKHRAYSQRAK